VAEAKGYLLESLINMCGSGGGGIVDGLSILTEVMDGIITLERMILVVAD
jgi:hypothetical protein